MENMKKIVLIILNLKLMTNTVKAQDACPEIVCDAELLPPFTCTYTGAIKPNVDEQGKPFLRGPGGGEGIEILVGCRNLDGTPSDGVPENLVIPDEYRGNFSISQQTKQAPKQIITLTNTYDIVTSMEISFTMQACSPNTPSNCKDIIVKIDYSFNNHGPEFNDRFGEGTIADAEACDGDSNAEECKIIMDNNFQASDGDGDLIKYRILPITDYSQNFAIANPNDLSSLYYLGNGIVEGVSVNLLLEASDVRTLDSISSVGVIKIIVETTATTAPPTTSSTTTPSGDTMGENEELYFILMIVFAVLFGLTLLLILLTPIIIKLCRKDNVFSMTGLLSKKAHLKNSGVVTTEASYTSFSEMNYDTAAGDTHSNTSSTSSPDLELKSR